MDVLVIDEISMVHPTFFEKAGKVVAAVRNQFSEPFGGLQLIIVGDFYQLPPVPDRNQPPGGPKFAFETDTWKSLSLHCVELTQIFRQEDASEFARALCRIRKGEVSDEDEDLLFDRILAHIDHAEGVIPTQLYSKRNSVLELNQNHLKALDADDSNTYEFSVQHSLADGVDERSSPAQAALKRYVEEVKTNCRVEPSIELRVGAQVMMLVNKPDMKLVNGSRGVVIGFDTDGFPRVRFSKTTMVVTPHAWKFSREHVGEVVVSQIPLQHAWAVTIHKSQGMTLDCAEIALDKGVFEYGQAYVALSRVKSLEGVRLVKFSKRVIRADPKVTEFYTSMVSE
jgi:ATP-dependent DNA helicase PIF1